MPPDRPVVHCLVARPLGDGQVTRTSRVPLDHAWAFFEAGWWVVGPDPDDVVALAQWEREHGQRPEGWR